MRRALATAVSAALCACALPDDIRVADATVTAADAGADVASDRPRATRRCDGGVCPPAETCSGDPGAEALSAHGCAAANASTTGACGAAHAACDGTCLRCACQPAVPRVLWARGFGEEDPTQQRQAAKATALDDDGGVYLLGRFSNVLRDSSGYASTRYAGPQTYLTAFAPDGTRRWLHALGRGTPNATDNMRLDRMGYAVTLAPDGDLYVAGPLLDAVTLPTPGGTAEARAAADVRDAFVARVHRERGEARWLRALGATEECRVAQLAVSPDGAWFAAGSVRATPEWGAVGQRDDAFVRAYHPDGSLAWSWRAAGDGDEQVNGVAVGPDVVVAVGEFNQRVDLGDGVPRSAGTRVLQSTNGPRSAFIVSLARDTGALRWARSLGDSTDRFMAVGLDAAQNAYVGAIIGSEFPFAGRTVTSPNQTGNPLNAAVLSYDIDGCERWVRAFGGDANDTVMALAADPDGTVYAGGAACRNLSFGDGVVPGGGCVSSFIVSYDRAGAFRWGRRFGTRMDHRNESVYSLSVNRHGRIAACGATASGDPDSFDLTAFPDGPIFRAGNAGYVVTLQP